MAYGFLAGGLILLALGSEAVARGGAAYAWRWNFPPLLTGLAVVAMATSLPELFVSLGAAAADAPGLALGAITGTCIANILLALGLTAVVRPVVTPPKVILRDGSAMLIDSAVLAYFVADGRVSRGEGVLLLALFGLYAAVVVLTDVRRSPDHSVFQARAYGRMPNGVSGHAANLFMLFFGVIGLLLGARLAVSGGVVAARELHLNASFVGLTVMALGLMLPKLVIALAALLRGQSAVAAGLLAETNVVDLLLVLGLTAVAFPVQVPATLIAPDAMVLVAAAAFILPLLAMRWRLSPFRGLLLIVVYVGYLIFLLQREHLIAWPGLG